MEYTKEEKEAIDEAKTIVSIKYGSIMHIEIRNMEKILNLLEKQQKENEKYKQIINKVIEYIGIDEDIEKTCEMYDVNGIEILKILNEIKGE